MKKNSVKPSFTTRVAAPIARNEKDGSAGLYCPFCKPTHKIAPGMESLCGTRLEVRAVQIVIRAKYQKDMVCVKCGKGGGDMVRFQNAFIHANDCTPGVATLTEPPEYSRLAKWIYKLPEFIKSRIEKKYGNIMPVDEVNQKGERTGVVLGYFFNKG